MYSEQSFVLYAKFAAIDCARVIALVAQLIAQLRVLDASRVARIDENRLEKCTICGIVCATCRSERKVSMRRSRSFERRAKSVARAGCRRRGRHRVGFPAAVARSTPLGRRTHIVRAASLYFASGAPAFTSHARTHNVVIGVVVAVT